MNNLKWHDAMAIMGRYFSDEERLAGWTESLTTKQIAVLQRPHKWVGSDAIELCKSLLNEINQDCSTGALRSTKQDPKASEKPIFGKRTSSQTSLKGEFLRGEAAGKKLVDTLIAIAIANPGRAVAISVYIVSAHDFKKWLHLKGELPSPHIQAWFDTVIPQTRHAHDVKEASTSPNKPLQRSAAQDAAILAKLREFDIDPLAVPASPSGLRGVKFTVRTALQDNLLFVGSTVFDKSWERLTKNGELVILPVATAAPLTFADWEMVVPRKNRRTSTTRGTNR